MTTEKSTRIANVYVPIGALLCALGALATASGLAVQAERRWTVLESGQAEAYRSLLRLEGKVDRVLSESRAMDKRITVLEAHDRNQ